MADARENGSATPGARPHRRSLILAGGGMKVGYQAGVLQVLLDEARPRFRPRRRDERRLPQPGDGPVRPDRHAGSPTTGERPARSS